MARLNQTISMLSARRKAMEGARLHQQGDALRSIAVSGPNPGHLRCLIHVPEVLAPSPGLVVVLHGCTQTAAGYARGAGWIEAADRHGFVLLCPEQISANNPNLCFNWFAPADTQRGKGEAASIATMTREVASAHGVPSDRVFVTGLSGGGAMANVMLATYPELFAAGAIMAGLPFGAAGTVQEAFAAMAHQRDASDDILGARVRGASDHSGAWPRVSVWHGDADTTVSPAAGQAIVRQWVNVHGARESIGPAAESKHAREWVASNGDVVVKHRRLKGMGHGVALATGADLSVGRAGPFMLDVGVPSTLEVVADWGLDQHLVSPSAKTRITEADLAASPQLAPRTAPYNVRLPSKATAIDIGETINNALRAAGLMK